MSNGLTVLYRDRPAPISKNRAFCVVVELPARLEPARRGSSIMVERARHWERVSLHGRTLRCHTELEAREACNLLLAGIDNGDFLAIAYSPYDPRPDDLPYHDWVRGEQRRVTDALGLALADLPEAQDPGLAKLSDHEWLTRGPR